LDGNKSFPHAKFVLLNVPCCIIASALNHLASTDADVSRGNVHVRTEAAVEFRHKTPGKSASFAVALAARVKIAAGYLLSPAIKGMGRQACSSACAY